MFEVYKDADGQWRWRLKAGNHQIVAGPQEGFTRRSKAKHNIEVVRRLVAAAPVVEVLVHTPEKPAG